MWGPRQASKLYDPMFRGTPELLDIAATRAFLRHHLSTRMNVPDTVLGNAFS